MGASCTKGYGQTVEPDPWVASADVEELHIGDSAADCIPAGYHAKRRQAVSAEVASSSLDNPVAVQKVHKSAHVEQGIRAAMQHCFLFADLEEEQKQDVVDVMLKRTVAAGDVLIRETEEGDNFYVIERGHFKATRGTGDAAKLLCTYKHAGAFGELALMYNCPRAATVTAESDGVLWCMDRMTFRSIVVASTMERRQRYEHSLASMPLLAALTPDQRAAIADCLCLETFEAGETILREDEELTPSSKFYLVQGGTVDCFKLFSGTRQHVKTIEAGGFFGEVALMEHVNSRAADCIAKDRVKLLTMSKDAFERLMGPAEAILSEQVADYRHLNTLLRANSMCADTEKGQNKMTI